APTVKRKRISGCNAGACFSWPVPSCSVTVTGKSGSSDIIFSRRNNYGTSLRRSASAYPCVCHAAVADQPGDGAGCLGHGKNRRAGAAQGSPGKGSGAFLVAI